MFRLHKKESNDLPIEKIPRERRAAISPFRDWVILVVTLSVLFVFLSIRHGYILWQIGNDSLVVVDEATQNAGRKVEKTDIQALISDMNARAATTRALDSRASFVDPSW